MAVINYSGSLEVAQNFTDDTDRLREVVKGTKLPCSPRIRRTAARGSRALQDTVRAI